MATRRPMLVLAALLAAPPVARAQIDYRNLDDDRPTLIEDAYPIERFAFELLAPCRFEAEPRGVDRHLVVPEAPAGVPRFARGPVRTFRIDGNEVQVYLIAHDDDSSPE